MILVTGSSGFLGRSIVSHFPESDVISMHYKNPCFTNSVSFNFHDDDIATLINPQNIKTVILAAHVEMETSSIAVPMKRLLRSFAHCRLIYISSDGIFNGKRGMYTEQDEPIPITPYGHNLLTCESLVKEMVPNHCIIRPSYIYGFSNGVLDTRLASIKTNLLAGKTVTAFKDMFKSPLGIGQVAKAIVNLSASHYIGTIHVAGERMSVADFRFQAMKALSVPTTNLKHVQMPTQSEYLPDTSLDISLWKELHQVKPLSIMETLCG